MSAKVVYTLEEDKQQLQKQLGCMNGIFQLFDRRYLLGQRRHSQNQKRLPPGQSDNGKKEFNNASEKAMDKNPKMVNKEKPRASVESSRNSFSSSCSSTTFSSAECSKRVQTEQSSFCQSIISEPSSPTLPRKQPDFYIQPPDIRDVVKDSMTREPRMISVKTVAKDERMGPAMQHVDSPRPFQQQKFAQYDRKDRNLAKLQEISCGIKEGKEIQRFSCDGRESRYSLKSTVKVKELPRLSLDSKQSYIRNSANESRRILLTRETQASGETEMSGQTLNQNHEPGSNKRSSASVVARLMGLEVLGDSNNDGETMKIKPCLDDELAPTSRSSRKDEEFNHNQYSNSPKVRKVPAFPQTGVAQAITKIPLEPAPWKQEGGRQGSQKPPFRHKEAPVTVEHASLSVYGEIEKRLTKLEFRTSGKDLRALKQILEAMQKTRRRLENKEQPLVNSSFDQRQSQKSEQPVSPTIKVTAPPKRPEFPNAIMKPAKLASDSVMITSLQKLTKVNHADGRKDLVGRQQATDLTSRVKKANGRNQRSLSRSIVPEYLTGEKSTSPRNPGSVSPRLRRSKNGINKLSVRGPPSDLSRARKQTSVQATGSDSKNKSQKTKFINPQGNSDQPCRSGSETRSLSQQGDTVSFQSESNTSLASQNEMEVTSTDWTRETNSMYQPKDNHRNHFAESLIEDKAMAELATLAPEQPSPVSVLDTFYIEDTPSPVKKKINAFRDDENLHLDEAEWNQVALTDNLANSTDDHHCSEFNHVKLKNIEHLVHQIDSLNSTNDETTINHNASPCERENGDHRYISEILLASGFLKDLNSAITIVQLHPTGNLINPELFHVLEKTRGCTKFRDDEYHEKEVRSISDEKIRRKMVFDIVNDILVHRLAMSGSYGLRSSKQKGLILNGEKLLKELCSEIDNLQANSDRGLDDEDDEVINIISADVNKKSEDWEEHCHEIPSLVLDIERMIFKDLVSEVVNAEAAGQQDWPVKHCRQLFPL